MPRPTELEEHTCAVCVTYGNRVALVEQTVSAALRSGVKQVILVANGVGESARQRLDELEPAWNESVSIFYLPRNVGSAGGYSAGIRVALTHDLYQYIWLLDDDNAPEPDALQALGTAYRHLVETVPIDPSVLGVLSLRPARSYLLRVARGAAVTDVFPSESSFLGLDLWRGIRKAFSRERRQVAPGMPIRIPFAPYGGLLLHREAFIRWGLPDERFVVYGDDTEYTSRLSRSGGSIWLVPSSIVHDIDAGQYQQRFANTFVRLASDSDERRMFYYLRNGVYVSRNLRMGSKTLYKANKHMFLFLLWMHLLVRGRLRRWRLYTTAIRHGEQNNLGEAGELDVEQG